jgi:hypothetical protein
MPMKLVRLIKFNIKTIICIRKHLPDVLPIQNNLNGDDLWPLLFNFSLVNVIKKVQKKSGKFGKEWDISNYGPS